MGTFLALLGPISEFCHMSEWWPTLPYHNRKCFRLLPAKSNDSNWIRSPKSMFWVIIGCLWWPIGDLLVPGARPSIFPVMHRMTEDHKIFHFRVIPANSNDSIFIKVSKTSLLGHFWPFLAIFVQIRIFPKNLIRPLFTPCTPLTSCQKSKKSKEANFRKTYWVITNRLNDWLTNWLGWVTDWLGWETYWQLTNSFYFTII